LILLNILLERNVLIELEKLKMISVAFTGVDHIDMDYCRENDITVRNSSHWLCHQGSFSRKREAFQERAEIVFANIEKWLAGDPQNVMN